MVPIVLFAVMTVRIGPMGPDAPAREPQIAANSSTVVLAFGAGNAIYFNSSSDRGKTFRPPAKVAEAGIVPLSRHRGPRIALSGIMIGDYGGGGEQVGGRRSRPRSSVGWRPAGVQALPLDGGKTWSKGRAINDVAGSATEGLHALTGDGKGTLFAAWLDGAGPRERSCMRHRSTDGGATWSPNVVRVRFTKAVRSANAATLRWRSTAPGISW